MTGEQFLKAALTNPKLLQRLLEAITRNPDLFKNGLLDGTKKLLGEPKNTDALKTGLDNVLKDDPARKDFSGFLDKEAPKLGDLLTAPDDAEVPGKPGEKPSPGGLIPLMPGKGPGGAYKFPDHGAKPGAPDANGIPNNLGTRLGDALEKAQFSPIASVDAAKGQGRNLLNGLKPGEAGGFEWHKDENGKVTYKQVLFPFGPDKTGEKPGTGKPESGGAMAMRPPEPEEVGGPQEEKDLEGSSDKPATRRSSTAEDPAAEDIVRRKTEGSTPESPATKEKEKPAGDGGAAPPPPKPELIPAPRPVEPAPPAGDGGSPPAPPTPEAPKKEPSPEKKASPPSRPASSSDLAPWGGLL